MSATDKMVVFCTYCGQRFTRDEHLERHILTHTQVKPYKCLHCHMSFARRDLLQRHYTVHGRDQNQQEIPAANGLLPRSAGRTPIACTHCAKTKTKCDKKFPCTRCTLRSLDCTLRPTRRATKGHPSGTNPMLMQRAQGDQQQRPLPAFDPNERRVKPSSPKEGQTNSSPEAKFQGPPVDGPPTQYYGQPTAGVPAQMSPLHTPVNGLIQAPHFGGYEDEPEGLEPTSPHFGLDWTQMQMPGFGGMIQPQQLMINHNAPFDPRGTPLIAQQPGPDGMMDIMPDLANGVHPLATPLETAKLSHELSGMDINQHSTILGRRDSADLSNLSDSSNGDVKGEMAPIIAAQDAWTVFRCQPTIPSTSCPKTARLNLERLEQTLKNHEGWGTWSPQWDEPDFAGDQLTVMQLHESTRDKLLAITQSFLHKALDIHREGGTSQAIPGHHPGGMSNFILLPPARVLEYFLRSYANCSERYYPLTSRGTLDSNELLHCYNDQAASLLVLMMIAQGAMNIPSVDARMLTGGLTEACRISLFDLIEKNIIMAGDPIVLHAALLFTVQAAWSGDKWQMDIAQGQRGMYFAMLRHSGMLENRPPSPPSMEQRGNTDQMWSEWISNESRSRLVYSWLMVDQEMALFHDAAPLFSVTEVAVPMPDADRLWRARSAAEWSSTFEQVHEFSGGYSSVGSGARPLSLRDLFRHFLDDELVSRGIEMTPLQLRLLLHPLQALVTQLSQLLSCFSDSSASRNSNSPSVTLGSTRGRLAEVQTLLQRWFDLAERYLKANPMCPMMQTNLVIFHLISANVVTDFPEIEKLARREGFDGTYQQLFYLNQRCIADIQEAVFHCGQVFRLVRSMSRGVRPPWWAGAIYRAGLILWANSLGDKEAMPSPDNGATTVPGPSFAIDALTPEHPLIVRYITKREGSPCVTKRDGSQMAIDRPISILHHCLEVLEEGASTRFSDGIRAKIERLSRG